MSPRRASPFLLGRQKKGTKEKATLLSATPSLRYGATWSARSRGSTAELAARLRRSAQTTAVSQFTKHARSDAHATPRPARPRRIQKGTHRTSTRAIASLRCARPRLAGASATRCESGAERSDGPGGCLAVRLSHPLLAAPAAGRLRGGTGVEAPVLRGLTRRGCPNGARQRAVSSAAHPATAPPQVCPVAQRRGRRLGVAFSLVTFSWRDKRKLPRRRARSPAPALGKGTPHRSASERSRPGFDKLSPNGNEVPWTQKDQPDKPTTQPLSFG